MERDRPGRTVSLVQSSLYLPGITGVISALLMANRLICNFQFPVLPPHFFKFFPVKNSSEVRPASFNMVTFVQCFPVCPCTTDFHSSTTLSRASGNGHRIVEPAACSRRFSHRLSHT